MDKSMFQLLLGVLSRQYRQSKTSLASHADRNSTISILERTDEASKSRELSRSPAKCSSFSNVELGHPELNLTAEIGANETSLRRLLYGVEIQALLNFSSSGSQGPQERGANCPTDPVTMISVKIFDRVLIR